MKYVFGAAIALAGTALAASPSLADTLPTHRIPAALAIEAASETISACAAQGYRETAVVLDADGATIVDYTPVSQLDDPTRRRAMRALRAYPGRAERDLEPPEPSIRASAIEDGAAVS